MPAYVGTSNTATVITQSGLARRLDDSTSLYAFTTITFTPCGASGRSGPTLANMQSTYSGYSWASNTAYLNNVGGINI